MPGDARAQLYPVTLNMQSDFTLAHLLTLMIMADVRRENKSTSPMSLPRHEWLYIVNVLQSHPDARGMRRWIPEVEVHVPSHIWGEWAA